MQQLPVNDCAEIVTSRSATASDLDVNLLNFESCAARNLKDLRCRSFGVLDDNGPDLDEFPRLLVDFHVHPGSRQSKERQSGFSWGGKFDIVLEDPAVATDNDPRRIEP